MRVTKVLDNGLMQLLDSELDDAINERVLNAIDEILEDNENGEALHEFFRDEGISIPKWIDEIENGELDNPYLTKLTDFLIGKTKFECLSREWVDERIRPYLNCAIADVFGNMVEFNNRLNLPLEQCYEEDKLEDILGEGLFSLAKMYNYLDGQLENAKELFNQKANGFLMSLLSVKDYVSVENVLSYAEGYPFAQNYLKDRLKEIEKMNIREKVAMALPEGYELVNVQRQSNHPSDGHLFLVEGMESTTGEYAVWEYSSVTGQLFNGDYRLTKADALSRLVDRAKDVYTNFNTKEECDKAFEKWYGAKPFQSFEVTDEVKSFDEKQLAVGE